MSARAIDPACALVTLTRMVARKAVKHQLAARGLKPTSFSLRQIALMAEEYIADHRAELVAEVRLRFANILTDAQRNRRRYRGRILVRNS